MKGTFAQKLANIVTGSLAIGHAILATYVPGARIWRLGWGEPMDLKTFVSETLKQVLAGVSEAQGSAGGELINAEMLPLEMFL
jgi:hypothetical protein